MADLSTDNVPVESSVVAKSPTEQSSSKSTHSGRSGGRSGGRSSGRGYRNHNKPQSGGNQLIDSVRITYS